MHSVLLTGAAHYQAAGATYRSSPIKNSGFFGGCHWDLKPSLPFLCIKASGYFSRTEWQEQTVVKSEWPVAQLPTALAEISIEELDSFSPSEDVSILPGRVHKGRCGTL